MSTSEKTPSSLAPKDHSSVAVVDKRHKEFYLVLLKQFELGTEYGSVPGYLKLLNENLHDVRRIMIDQTGVGEPFMSMASVLD